MPRPNLNAVPNEGLTPVAPACGAELSPPGWCGVERPENRKKCNARPRGDDLCRLTNITLMS
jgi:hypothetical protein